LTVRLCGIRIDVSYYFFALLTAFFLLEPDNITACGALSAIIHECGHLAAMLIVPGASVERVTVSACGLRIRARLLAPRKGWSIVCIAGAAANLLLAGLLLICAMVCDNRFLSVFASANICIGTVNLLPVEPMDGGQLMRALMLRIASPENADRICFLVSIVTLIPLVCAGLWLLMSTQFNFSLLLLSLWLLGGVLDEYLN